MFSDDGSWWRVRHLPPHLCWELHMLSTDMEASNGLILSSASSVVRTQRRLNDGFSFSLFCQEVSFNPLIHLKLNLFSGLTFYIVRIYIWRRHPVIWMTMILQCSADCCDTKSKPPSLIQIYRSSTWRWPGWYEEIQSAPAHQEIQSEQEEAAQCRTGGAFLCTHTHTHRQQKTSIQEQVEGSKVTPTPPIPSVIYECGGSSSSGCHYHRNAEVCWKVVTPIIRPFNL